MAKIAIAIHACGFESENWICKAFRSRLTRAYGLICALLGPNQQRNQEVILIITGGVPYKKSGRLLACCAIDNFEETFFNIPCPVFYADNCYNSSTDTQNVLEICREQKVDKVIVVTSYWHNWMVRQMYSRFNNTPRLTVNFAKPASRDWAGLKTVIKYAIFGILVLLARLTGQFRRLDKFLNEKQKNRQEEFQEIGCD